MARSGADGVVGGGEQVSQSVTGRCVVLQCTTMDTTIRNLDAETYRRLKAHAALTGKSIGEAMNEAMRVYLERRPARARVGTLADWKPVAFPPGNEHLSEEIDRILYGSEPG